MTRRKKYAIMMKTRCAKGENAVENLIPRWYRELELFRGVKPLLVLEGCVMDQVRDTRNTDESWLARWRRIRCCR